MTNFPHRYSEVTEDQPSELLLPNFPTCDIYNTNYSNIITSYIKERLCNHRCISWPLHGHFPNKISHFQIPVKAFGLFILPYIEKFLRQNNFIVFVDLLATSKSNMKNACSIFHQ